ncbi:MAG TPA: hypothetical protein VMZ71_00880, partial [Gemmataceae bacterium]|nr:hypothetical protein [Gemmataceae bacterium]
LLEPWILDPEQPHAAGSANSGTRGAWGTIADFPARLFRVSRPSTATNEEQLTDHEAVVLPDTQRIRPLLAPADPAPEPPVAEDSLGFTVETVAVPVVPDPPPPEGPPVVTRPPAPAPESRLSLWWWVAGVLAVALLCRLIWLGRW